MTPFAKLVIGLLGASAQRLMIAEEAISQRFGQIELRSQDIPFDFTDYYKAEFGSGLIRRWIGIAGMVAQERLAELKLACGQLEQALAVAGCRTVNIDPGLLTLHSLVLATTKAHAHRIYLRDGIYAELTLRYQHGRFEPLDWTYPDYRSGVCHEFLGRCRARLTDEIGVHCRDTKAPSRAKGANDIGAGQKDHQEVKTAAGDKARSSETAG